MRFLSTSIPGNEDGLDPVAIIVFADAIAGFLMIRRVNIIIYIEIC